MDLRIMAVLAFCIPQQAGMRAGALARKLSRRLTDAV